MLDFIQFNANPKGRKTGDCSTRAIATTLDISYEDALNLQCKESIKHCYGITNKETADAILKHFGYEKQKQPKKPNGSKYTVKELEKILSWKEMQEGVLVSVANHFTCIKNGKIVDIWNCGGKTVCNYWIKTGAKDAVAKEFTEIKRDIKPVKVKILL